MTEFEELFKDEFFIIDSNNLDLIKSNFYGFMLRNGKIIEKENFNFEKNDISLEGAYVLLQVNEDTISIKQDYIGAYGLYIYEKENNFVISNSFLKLIDYLRNSKKISLNETFADSFLFSNLYPYSLSETIVNEIRLIPRYYQISINKNKKTIEFIKIDYQEQTISLDSKEGIRILDSWYNKWVDIFRHYYSMTNYIEIELSGGFDTRITAAIWLTSNVDLNNLHVSNYDPDINNVYKEDYRIASEIANEFKFKLNKKHVEPKKNPFKELNTILGISYYTKLGTTKYMRWKSFRYSEKSFLFTGICAETIRGYPNQNQKDYTEKWRNLSKSYGTEFEIPTKKIIDSSFSKLKEDFPQIQDPYTLSERFYTEIGNRYHHGTEIVEYYLSNKIEFAPSMDPKLHKLKLTIPKCNDRQLLVALIFQRYCPKLLSFDFEGNREISESTINFAKEINKKYPFKKQNRIFIQKPKLNEIREKDNYSNNLFNKDVNDFLIDVFNSELFKNEFLKYYSTKAYYKIKNEVYTFGLMKNIHSSILILKTIDDINGGTIFKNESKLLDLQTWLENFLKYDKKPNKGILTKEFLSKYATLRIDFNSIGSKNNTVEIIYSSDDECDIDYPLWFITQQGKGVVMETYKGEIDLKIKCINDGILKLNFRSIDFKYQNKKIPIYIIITKIILNNDILLNEDKLVWHEDYISIKKEVMNNDEFFIHVEWKPLSPFPKLIKL